MNNIWSTLTDDHDGGGDHDSDHHRDGGDHDDLRDDDDDSLGNFDNYEGR